MMHKWEQVIIPAPAARPADLIGELIFNLDAAGVRYCHWKSNLHIKRWLDGEGDLDLLVSRRDAGEFYRVLATLGFKKVLVAPEDEMPGILNFYGYDAERQKLVHVHAHFQLTLGHDLTKNYRLPLENVVVETAVRRDGIYISAPEAELLLYVLRMTLKNSLLENVLRRALGKSKSHEANILAELDYLESQVNEFRLAEMLRQYAPTVSLELFAQCRRAMREAGDLAKKSAVRRRLERALAVNSRTGKARELATSFIKRSGKLLRKARGKSAPKKRFETGGALIAFVGGDGAGKTTCVNDVGRWLAKKFVVRRYHFGKPPKSLLTLIAGAALKLRAFLKLGKDDENSFGEQSLDDRRNNFWQCLRWVGTARDRYRLYRRMRREAANGAIVLCDRYSIIDLHLMDAPKIRALAPRANGLDHILSRAERWYYRRIQPPDFMFVLRVDPNTAVSRKTNEPRAHVFSRTKELWDFNWQKKRAVLIDAARPLEVVQAELRRAVWKIL